jgi:hypothetical protein
MAAEPAKYSFSESGAARLSFVFFIIPLIAAIYSAESTGIQNVPPISVLIILALAAGAAYSALGIAFPLSMSFYEGFVKMRSQRARPAKEIPYNQITKVSVVQEKFRRSYSYGVVFYISGRPKPYLVPKAFTGEGLSTSEKSSEAKGFASWLKAKAGLPNQPIKDGKL